MLCVGLCAVLACVRPWRGAHACVVKYGSLSLKVRLEGGGCVSVAFVCGRAATPAAGPRGPAKSGKCCHLLARRAFPRLGLWQQEGAPATGVGRFAPTSP